MNATGVLICGHGSRDEEAVREFELLAAALRPRFPQHDFATGYLEFARPNIREGLAALVARGARRIYAVPGMLFAASHVKNDLPWEMNSFLADNPGIELRLGRDLAIDTRLINAAADRVAAAIPGDRSEALLVVVGRGTNDPDANSNISKIARMLWEGLGFGWAEVAYSDARVPILRVGGLNLRSVPLDTAGEYDCVVITTDHKDVDYADLCVRAQLVVDTRNATRAVRAKYGSKIVSL